MLKERINLLIIRRNIQMLPNVAKPRFQFSKAQHSCGFPTFFAVQWQPLWSSFPQKMILCLFVCLHPSLLRFSTKHEGRRPGAKSVFPPFSLLSKTAKNVGITWFSAGLSAYKKPRLQGLQHSAFDLLCSVLFSLIFPGSDAQRKCHFQDQWGCHLTRYLIPTRQDLTDFV